MKRKLFYVIACLVLVAALNIPVFANMMAIDSVDLTLGTGWLSSYTGQSYADTVADDGGTPSDDPEIPDEVWNWVEVELFIDDGPSVEYQKSAGTGKTTAWVRCAESGGEVHALHWIQRGHDYDHGSTTVTP